MTTTMFGRALVSATRARLRPPYVARRCMATVQQPDGPSDAKKAEITLKRFWKTSDVEEKPDAFFVTLDKRPLKTPGGKRLEIPKSKRLLATLVAYEWDNQEKLIKPHALPLTSLAARALDDLTDEQNRAEVRAALIKYLDTDSICFHGDEPEGLVKLQHAHWDPIIDWARKEFDVELTVFTGLFGSSQPAETKAKLAKVLEDMDAWQLAGLERAVYASKSLIVALALVRGRISPEEAAQAAHVEVSSQIQRWGEVEDSHDVDHQDIRRQLGSVTCLLANV